MQPVVYHLKMMRSPQLEVVLDEIEEHESRLCQTVVRPNEEVPLYYAARMAGCEWQTFVKICEKLNLNLAVNPQPATTMVLSDHVAAVRAFCASSITPSQVSGILQCSRAMVRKMVQMGLLSVRLQEKKGFSTLLSLADFTKILEAVSVPLEPMSDDNDDYLTVRRAAETLWFDEAAILAALTSGSLLPVGRLAGSTGLHEIIVHRQQLIDAMLQLTGKVTVDHAAKEVGLPAETIWMLMRKGILAGIGTHHVHLEELKQFHEMYVSLAEIATWDCAFSMREIPKVLEAKGVLAATTAEKHELPFWPRRDATCAFQS